MTRTILLDIDGVIVRDPLLLEHVRNNVVSYVKTKLPGCNNPHRVNNILYKMYGHSGLGLSKAFQIDTRDFNKSVYTPKLIDHLLDSFKSSEFIEDSHILREMAEKNKIVFFSNAPLEWSIPVRESISHKISISYDGYMKPDLNAYVNFNHKNKYVFVDDKIDNLRPIQTFPHWKLVHFSEEEKSSEFLRIGTMWELSLFINSLNEWDGR
jgi:hypothetical protein